MSSAMYAMSKRLMPDERVLWESRPSWQAVARDVMYVGWLGLYVALLVIWHAADNRAAGLSPMDTLMTGVPLAVLCLLVLGGLTALSFAIARTTTYTLTTHRCILNYGVALTGSLSIPLHKLASISIAVHGDTTGDILLELKPGTKIGFLKLWPHVRPWRFGRPQPMLRGVVAVADVAARLSEATANVSKGVVYSMPEPSAKKTSGKAATPAAAILSAGD